jgi:hypothetical protein
MVFRVAVPAKTILGGKFMRMMLRIHLDATHGSAALKSGALQKAIGAFEEKFKPEATYFSLERG